MKLRVVITDDERIARQRLRGLLAKEPHTEIVAECADGPSTIEAVRQSSPDIVFLDIQMPGMNGFDVVDLIAPFGQPAIVFVTGFDKHAVHAFETCALDYLLKPVAPERLGETLRRARNYIATASKRSSLPQLGANALSALRFSVRSGQRTSFIAPEQIDWIEADGNYAVLHAGNQNHFLRETMSILETKLPARDFMRVNRSAIVHLKQVKEIRAGPGRHHSAILISGQEIAITRSIREIEARLHAL
jgi:two-component system, LytTR family, response regulator